MATVYITLFVEIDCGYSHGGNVVDIIHTGCRHKHRHTEVGKTDI